MLGPLERGQLGRAVLNRGELVQLPAQGDDALLLQLQVRPEGLEGTRETDCVRTNGS